MMSEYGADTLPGLHASPAWMFSEDYQSELLMKHHRAFDILRAQGGFIGEHIWNFADFMTAQGSDSCLFSIHRSMPDEKMILSILRNLNQPSAQTGTTRVIGNRKGILTRQRQPKAAAKIIRCRYHTVGNLTGSDDSFYCPRNADSHAAHEEF